MSGGRFGIPSTILSHQDDVVSFNYLEHLNIKLPDMHREILSTKGYSILAD